MIRKLTEAGYIGVLLATEDKTSASLILWGCFWCIVAIVGFAVLLYLIFGTDYYEDRNYYKGTVPRFVWSGVLFSLSVYFCLGTASIFKWIFIFLTLVWCIKTCLNLKRVYVHFNSYTQSSFNRETTVDFKTVKNLYQVSKHRFQLPKYYQSSLSWDRCLYELDFKTNRVGPSMVQLTLPNFVEFLKFYVWDYYENRDYAKHKARKQRAKDIESNKRNLEMVISQAQADIDMLKEKANAEIEQANEMMAGVKENMKKTNKT